MKLDRQKIRIILAMTGKKRKDIAEQVPDGTLAVALLERNIRDDTAQRIAQALGVSVQAIAKDE